MTKPFNYADAKAGHPVCTKGAHVPGKLLAVDLSNGPLLYQLQREIYYCNELGVLNPVSGAPMVPTDLVMAPLGTLAGREVYPGNMLVLINGDTVPAPHGVSFDASLYAGWPVPERVYPVTQMSNVDLSAEFSFNGDLTDVANAAIHHGIYNGYLLDPEADADSASGSVRGRILAEIAKGLGWDSGYAYAAIPAAVRMREVAIARHFYEQGSRAVINGSPYPLPPQAPRTLDWITSELTKVK